MSEIAKRMEAMADGLAAEIEPPYSECRLTVGQMRQHVKELRRLAGWLNAEEGSRG